MTKDWRDERGETLVEIVIAIVIIGIVVGSFFASIATTSTGSKAHRFLVTADAMLRDSAELTKSQVRAQCISGPTYSVDFSSLANSGVTPPPNIPSTGCPPVVPPLPTVTLTVTWPSHTRSIDVVVRKP